MFDVVGGDRRVQDVAHLVDPQFRQDGREFIREDPLHAVLDAATRHQVHSLHVMRLADAVDPPDPLLDPHGIPWQVVVEDDVTELQVDAFSSSVCGDEDLGRACELLLRRRAFLGGHLAVDEDDPVAPVAQSALQHALRGLELREDEHLEVRISFLCTELVNLVCQLLRLGIRTLCSCCGSQRDQFLDPGLLRTEVRGGGIDHGTSIEQIVGLEQPVAGGSPAKDSQPVGQAVETCLGGAVGHTHEEQHQEPEHGFVLTSGLGVHRARKLLHAGAEGRLLAMRPVVQRYRAQMCVPGVEQWLAVVVERLPLLRAQDVPREQGPVDVSSDREGLGIQNVQQPLELPGLALMGRRREQQDTRGGLCEGVAQDVAGHAVAVSRHLVALIDDDEVPSCGDKLIEPQAVVLGNFRVFRSAAAQARLDCIKRDDDLVEEPPRVGRRSVLVLAVHEAGDSGQVAWRDDLEVLVEALGHLGLPLSGQRMRYDDEHTADLAAELELLHDKAGFDRLAQPDLVGQEKPGVA